MMYIGMGSRAALLCRALMMAICWRYAGLQAVDALHQCIQGGHIGCKSTHRGSLLWGVAASNINSS